jgi:hypothetical protein
MLRGPLGLSGSARQKPSRAGAASALAAITLGAAACGGGRPATRAFGSTELEPTRDSTILLYGENTTGVIDYSTGGGLTTTPVWWTLDLTTGAVRSYGSSPPPSPTPTSTPQPFTCDNDYTLGDPSGSFTLKISDTTTNVETEVHDVVSYASCPGTDRMLTTLVLDTSGGLVLESGPFDQLTPSQLPIGVLGVVTWNFAAASVNGPGPLTSVTVLAAQVITPDQEEVDTIDLATGDVTVVVPAVPASVGWATGATAAGTLQSTSVTGSAFVIEPIDGHYLYPRAMSDGGATVFAGPFASSAASEVALFELPAGTPLPFSYQVGFSQGVTSRPNKALVTWQLGGSAGAASDLVVWNDTELRLTRCASAAGALLSGVWSPDQSKVLFGVPEGTYTYNGNGPLDLLTLGGAGGADSCQQLVDGNVVAEGFSPDGAFIFWVIQPASGTAQLWVAASDGTGARMIGSGQIYGTHFIGDGQARLEMILGGELSWLDLHDTTGTLHHVAEQVNGAIYDITGGHWLIMGYQWSSTDGTGTLAVINRDDGEVRPISQSVSQYEVLIDGVSSDGGLVSPFGDAAVGTEFVVVYVVRGRNPSPQDGIWRATITPSELQ